MNLIFSLRALAVGKVLHLLSFQCRSAAGKPVVQDGRSEDQAARVRELLDRRGVKSKAFSISRTSCKIL